MNETTNSQHQGSTVIESSHCDNVLMDSNISVTHKAAHGMGSQLDQPDDDYPRCTEMTKDDMPDLLGISDDSDQEDKDRFAKHMANVQHGLPKANGCYIQGTLQGIEVTFTLDGGALETMVSSKVFKRMPVSIWPQLKWVGDAKGLDGHCF